MAGASSRVNSDAVDLRGETSPKKVETMSSLEYSSLPICGVPLVYAPTQTLGARGYVMWPWKVKKAHQTLKLKGLICRLRERF